MMETTVEQDLPLRVVAMVRMVRMAAPMELVVLVGMDEHSDEVSHDKILMADEADEAISPTVNEPDQITEMEVSEVL